MVKSFHIILIIFKQKKLFIYCCQKKNINFTKYLHIKQLQKENNPFNNTNLSKSNNLVELTYSQTEKETVC